MNRQEFRRRVLSAPLWLDGAMGTELAKRGLPPGAAPEAWVIDHPSILKAIHAEYVDAGSELLYACTFGANRLKLADHGLAHRTEEINHRIVAVAREASGGKALVFGDLAPTGRFVEPGGDLAFDEAVEVFKEQAAAQLAAGVDGFVIETMMDIQETRAALLGIRAVAPDKPVMASLTYEAGGRTLGGMPPEVALVTLQALGADAVGCNCSSGPEAFMPLLAGMAAYARVPLLVKPNAGAPIAEPGGGVRYAVDLDRFAAAVREFLRLGVRLIGGCCGTTPRHIQVARAAAADGTIPPMPDQAEGLAAVSSARRLFSFARPGAGGGPLAVVGERINPTGKKKFQAELRAGHLESIERFAEAQLADGADLLDVNVGLAGLDETATLRAAVARLTRVAPDAPLAIDTADPEAMEAALRLYPGRALVNSVSAEPERLEKLLPVAARYGAMLLVLPVGAGGVPEKAEERLAVAREVLAAARMAGYGKDDVLVDGLAMAVSADAAAGLETLEFLDRCTRELGVRTVLGLSNVSFGLPGRAWINATFLAMAMGRGLTAVIANPAGEALREVRTAADALLGRDPGMVRLVGNFKSLPTLKSNGPRQDGGTAPTSGSDPAAASPAPVDSPGVKAGNAVLRGDIGAAARLAEAALAAGVPAAELVDRHLIPAIGRAGALFEAKTYYLPQLMLAGEAMSRAMAVAEPLLEAGRAGGARKGRIVMATVKGDVHDIGKNLVALMLKNHDYEVIDLGKDVSPEAVVSAARERDADIVGLSALMTTTLPAMRDTVAALRAAGLRAKVMIGGAAATAEYAKEIGADGYAADAIGAVHLADQLVKADGRSDNS